MSFAHTIGYGARRNSAHGPMPSSSRVKLRFDKYI